MVASIARSKKILSAILFQLGWWGNIFLAKSHRPWLPLSGTLIIGVLFFTFIYKTQFKKEALYLFLVTFYGFVTDSLLNVMNIFKIGENSFIPLWLASIWFVFGLTLFLYESIKSYPTLSLLGAIFGPISYAAGLKFSLIELPRGNMTYLILAVTWGFHVPFLVYLRRKIFSR